MQDQALTILNLSSCAAFAASGVVASRHCRPDVIGAYTVAFASAFGGGIVRDAILGIPAQALQDDWALFSVWLAASVAMFLPRALARWSTVVDALDALGMAIAWQHGAHPAVVVLLGSLTAAGGGVIRDVLLNHMPQVMLPSTLFVSACLVGGVVGLGARWSGLGVEVCGLIVVVVTTGLRLLAMRFGWKLQAL